MYKLLILFIITLIYIVNNRKVDKKIKNFIYINKICEYFPKSRIDNNVTFVCPDSTNINDKGVKIPSKNELLVNFNKYYTYDKNNKLIDKVFLSNTLNGNFNTLSICNQPGNKDCKTLNLYLVSPRDPNEISVDQSNTLNSEKESSLVYDIDLINKNIIKKDYDPYKNIFHVTLDKDSKDDKDIILKLNNNNNLVYELNGVRLKNVQIHSLEVLNNNKRLDSKSRRDFVLISHNTLSNKKSFLIIKLKYISLNDINKEKLLSIKILNNLPKDDQQINELTVIDSESTPAKNKINKKDIEFEIMEQESGNERVIELDENKMLLDLNIYNENEVYINNVEIQNPDYKFVITAPNTYNIKYKNKIYKLIFKNSKDTKHRTYRFIQGMWIFTIINVFYSLYKFYFESLNYIIFLVLFTNHLNGSGSENAGGYVGKLIKYLLIYVDDKNGNLNIDMAKSFVLVIFLHIVVFVIILLYGLLLLFSTSTLDSLSKKVKVLKRYKMNVLILLNYLGLLIVIIYIKLYKNVQFIYIRGLKMSSFSFNLLTSVVIFTLALTIYHLYPKSLKKNDLEENKIFKLTDILKYEEYGTLSTAGSIQNGYKQRLITKPEVPKDRNVIIIDRKYQMLYINSIISETLVVVCFYLTSKKTDKETGIFLIKFLYWFLISVYIQRNCGYYNQDKFNRYLLTKSLRYLAVTSFVILQMFVKKEFMAYLIIIYVNHCINHKVVYNIIKLAKKYKYVVSS